jgi:hypothetical protein
MPFSKTYFRSTFGNVKYYLPNRKGKWRERGQVSISAYVGRKQVERGLCLTFVEVSEDIGRQGLTYYTKAFVGFSEILI